MTFMTEHAVKRVHRKKVKEAEERLNAGHFFWAHLEGLVKSMEEAERILVRGARDYPDLSRAFYTLDVASTLIKRAIRDLDDFTAEAGGRLYELVGEEKFLDAEGRSEDAWAWEALWPTLVSRASRTDIVTTAEILRILREAKEGVASSRDLAHLPDPRSHINTLNHLGWTIREEPSNNFRLVAEGGEHDEADKAWVDSAENRLDLLRLIVVLQCARIYATTGETGLGAGDAR